VIFEVCYNRKWYMIRQGQSYSSWVIILCHFFFRLWKFKPLIKTLKKTLNPKISKNLKRFQKLGLFPALARNEGRKAAMKQAINPSEFHRCKFLDATSNELQWLSVGLNCYGLSRVTVPWYATVRLRTASRGQPDRFTCGLSQKIPQMRNCWSPWARVSR